MPEVDNDGRPGRVIIRHTGPPGKGLPDGGTIGQILVKNSGTDYDTEWANPPDGTGAVTGPGASVDGNFAIFDGTGGDAVRDSGRGIGYYASVGQLSQKEDKVAGKGLSTEDFTTAEKAKLANIAEAGFRGVFETLAELDAEVFDPAPRPGDYAYVEATGDTLVLVTWDSTNEEWTPFTLTVTYDGAAIADALFSEFDSPDYVQAECRIYTTTEKSQVAAHEAALSAVGLIGTLSRGQITYFNTTGTAVTIALTSDGLTNMVKIAPVSALLADSVNFDNGGADNGRLRYTGTTSKNLRINYNVAFTGAGTGDYVFAVAKNGTVVAETRVAGAVNASGEILAVAGFGLITLLENEYIEVFIGRTAGTLDPTILSLGLMATAV